MEKIEASKFKLVFDDLPESVGKILGPVARDLNFGLTFWAKSKEDAERIAREGMAETTSIGRWHIEEVPSAPAR